MMCVNVFASVCLFSSTVYLLCSLAVRFLGDNVATWTLTDLDKLERAKIFSGLSIWTPHNSLNTFTFASSSHHFSPPLPERAVRRQAVSGLEVDGIWQTEGCVLMEVGAALLWRPAGPHQPARPFCPTVAARVGVAGPSLGGQMVSFGGRPQHSALCSWGSAGAAKNKHGLLLLRTFRSWSGSGRPVFTEATWFSFLFSSMWHYVHLFAESPLLSWVNMRNQ